MSAIVFIGLPFFKSMRSGWIKYYCESSGPKFTEEQIRLADEAAWALENCHPIEDVLDGLTHAAICQSLGKGDLLKASQALDYQKPSLTKRGWCIEALKIGIWLLGMTTPETVRKATLNLLACEHFFPVI
jgi:hypothetical protein